MFFVFQSNFPKILIKKKKKILQFCPKNFKILFGIKKIIGFNFDSLDILNY